MNIQKFTLKIFHKKVLSIILKGEINKKSSVLDHISNKELIINKLNQKIRSNSKKAEGDNQV